MSGLRHVNLSTTNDQLADAFAIGASGGKIFALALSVLVAHLAPGQTIAHAQDRIPDIGIGPGSESEQERIRRDLQRWRSGETVESSEEGLSPATELSEDELGRLRTLIDPDSPDSLRQAPNGEGRESDELAEGAIFGNDVAVPGEDVPGPYHDVSDVVDDESGATVNLTPPGDRKPTFRIGIVPHGDVGRLLEDLDPMRKTLARALSRPVEILPIASLSALVDAQVLKRVDLAFLSTSAYVTADQLCRCVEPLVAPLASDGTMASYALIVALRGSGFSTLADLEGKLVAVAPADSVAGRLYQLASLKADGLDPGAFFGAIKNNVSTVEAVLSMRDGLADAAFAWSSLAGPVASGYTRGTFSHLVGQGQLGMNEIQIVWKSRPLTNSPVSVLKSLDAEDKRVLTDYLVAAAESDPAIYDILDPVYGGGYQPIVPSDYHGASVLARQSVDAGDDVKKIPVPRLRGAAAPDVRGTGTKSDDLEPAALEPSITGSSLPGALEPEPDQTIFLPAKPAETLLRPE